MSLTKRIWIILATVIAIGVIMSYIVRNSGEQAGISSRNLVSVTIPKLNLIKQLRASITEHERLLYEYYARTTREGLWEKIKSTETELADQLMAINEGFSGHVMTLPKLYGEIKALQNAIDVNLISNSTDWDQARADLAQLTKVGQQAEAILVTLTKEVEEHAQQQTIRSQQQIQEMVNLVILYTLVIMASALVLGYFTQINIRKTAKRRALAKFPERNPNPVMNLNWQGEILFANPASQKLLKEIYPESENLTDLLPTDFQENLKSWQKNYDGQINFNADIDTKHLEFSLSLLRDLESCHLYIEDVTERKEAQDQLEYQAFHDVHTGLPNRRKFELDLTHHIKHTQACSILLISIDRFKFITASQGYHIGDDIIHHLGKRLQELTASMSCQIDTYRLEASTFCLLVSHANTNEVLYNAKLIQGAMDEALYVNQHSYYLNLSMGYCHYPQDGNTTQGLISNAHAALNHARKLGDSIEAYHPQFHASEQSWLPIERGMREALEKHQFIMFYQAKVDAQSGKICAAESLIRWFKEDGSMMSPATFIPVAEQTGLIIQIGYWIIEQGFKQAKQFHDAGHNIQIAINISARQFQYRHFLDQLSQLIESTQVNPQHIELEITESLIMENADQSISIMKKLKAMGFSLAIDDFGTGYSSLSYLKQFPIDSLKIDQAFVKHLESDENDKSIVAAIIDLAQHLKLKTIAEGVETHEQWQILKNMQCDYIQGYYFSKPSTPDKLLA
ncbi:MAG: bifunctional diguanylate cyclase/phosphodiesterase [Gammaproteobacteria bacterium]|nr:bifunctional diguanylate cyclase/phosphodiesterase [Gammaproteobacteria bacterium]